MVNPAAPAIPLPEETPELANDVTTAAIYLCRIVSGQTAKLKIPENELVISKYLADWYRRLLVHENEEATQKVLTRLEDVERVLPTAGRVLRESALA